MLATISSPTSELEIDWISDLAVRIGDPDILLETAGVLFAFNTINRIADARRVRLEYQFLRNLKPVRGWIERRLVSVASLAYDMSFKHKPRHSKARLHDRLNVLLERLGANATPDVFNWLSRSPGVLEGVLEMIEVNVMGAGVHADLLREAVAIGVASRSMPGSDLRRTFDGWLPREAIADSRTLRAWAAPAGFAGESDLTSACRRYAWQVANAAYTITDEQISRLAELGLSDAERLDLTLATAAFSALAIIEQVSTAVAPEPSVSTPVEMTRIREVEVQIA